MKIRKALLVEKNELVTPREYEEMFKKCNDRKEVRCSCGAKLSFVETHTRSSGKDNSSIVSAFFRDSKTSVHKEDCPYNISNRIKEIVAESQCLPIEKGKYILSLKNPYNKKSTKTNNNTLSYDRYSKGIYADNKYYNNYLKTIRDVLRLRDDLESNADLSQFVLYFGKEQVKWKDFYFAFKQYGGILKIIHKGYPICIEGDIYHIGDKNKPSLFLYGEEIVDEGKEKTIAIKLVSKEYSLIKDYPNGCHAIVYGTVSLDRYQTSTDYLNIVMWINDHRQIIKVE
ncbi:hypothetical protein JMN12_10955 [Capnocytophaga genosp. AHN8471]|uniref:hypothetical protein n=1 Tax=Capnocytophaga genosp. AHN8471 TaxID=327574 RepID=UPI0019340697|nr:hypothetical protein [Capnocytophaga genosp. AHN8471]MBM0657054.1 hypothetical protein [Capnocytophaga genosp. AHN8471]